MSDQTPTPEVDESDLGPMPTPEADPAEVNPGGVDALPEDDSNLPADPDPDANPVVAAAASKPIKEAVSGGEDTSTEATDSESGDTDSGSEDPA